ncbi:MAG TPA: prenyltransferase/squalene oxidase repeat-containing protein [Fimbriiglobus sp.]
MSASSAGGSIIHLQEFAGETAHERLLRKHVPSWVISGAVNLTLVAGLLLADFFFKTAAAKPSDQQLTAVIDEKDKVEAEPDLTEPDIGLDPLVAAALENVPLKADVNVEAPVKEAEPVGVPNATTNESFTALPGLSAADATTPGAAGTLGDVMRGAGTNGTMVNSGLMGRSGATKNMLLKAGGGNEASEAAVGKGLAWLAKQQKPNGSWAFDGSARSESAVATGMALLPFLAAGQTHKPAAGNKYQKTVENGLNYLLRTQLSTGQFAIAESNHIMYGHAICTIAVCEAYGMTGDKSRLLNPAQKAINFIAKAQGSDGSWGYTPGGVGDTSIVGWQVQALHSARMCKDMAVDKTVLDRARKFLDKIAGPGSIKDTYGYSLASPGRTGRGTVMTSVGLLCRVYLDGWGDLSPGLKSGVEGINANPPTPNYMNMYYYYYATQDVYFFGGDEWRKKWNPKMRDMLINLQSKTGTNAGSWTGDNYLLGGNVGRLGTTCMALLTLEVYYRHLPLYKRGTGGLNEIERGR